MPATENYRIKSRTIATKGQRGLVRPGTQASVNNQKYLVVPDRLQAGVQFVWAVAPKIHTTTVRLAGSYREFSASWNLPESWTGVESPSSASVATAKLLEAALIRARVELIDIGPSVVGGVGITAGSEDRTVYVEIRNSGKANFVCQSADQEPAVRSVQPSSIAGIAEFVDAVRKFLDA